MNTVTLKVTPMQAKQIAESLDAVGDMHRQREQALLEPSLKLGQSRKAYAHHTLAHSVREQLRGQQACN